MGKSTLIPVYLELMEKEGYGIHVQESVMSKTQKHDYTMLTKLILTLTGPKWEERMSKHSGAASALGSLVPHNYMVDAWRNRDMYNFELATTSKDSYNSFFVQGSWYQITAKPKEEIPNLDVYKFLGRYVAYGDRLETVKKVMDLLVKPLSDPERRLLKAFFHGNASIPGAQADLEEEIRQLSSQLAVANGALDQLAKREFVHVDNLIIEHSAKLMSLATSGKVHPNVNKAALALIKIE